MVHQFFEKIKNDTKVVNLHSSMENEFPKLSLYFPLFFPRNKNLNENFCTWLNAIATSFTFDYKELAVHRSTIKQTQALFNFLGIDHEAEENKHVYQFWIYIVWMYRKILKVPSRRRNDNIFAFMEGFPISKTKIVMLGEGPSRFVHSSGYAFHGSKCTSTRQLVKFLNTEMDILSRFNEEFRLSINQFKGAMKSCSLEGWIKQNVLLLNSVLTYCTNKDLQEGWDIFTNYVIKYLSKNLINVVFLMVGRDATYRKKLVDRKRHLVLSLYHPAFYRHLLSITPRHFFLNLHWSKALPFFNANLYLYQTRSESDKGNPFCCIDWSSVTHVNDATKKERLDVLQKVMDKLITAGNTMTSSGLPRLIQDLIVRRNINEYLYVQCSRCPDLKIRRNEFGLITVSGCF